MKRRDRLQLRADLRNVLDVAAAGHQPAEDDVTSLGLAADLTEMVRERAARCIALAATASATGDRRAPRQEAYQAVGDVIAAVENHPSPDRPPEPMPDEPDQLAALVRRQY